MDSLASRLSDRTISTPLARARDNESSARDREVAEGRQSIVLCEYPVGDRRDNFPALALSVVAFGNDAHELDPPPRTSPGAQRRTAGPRAPAHEPPRA